MFRTNKFSKTFCIILNKVIFLCLSFSFFNVLMLAFDLCGDTQAPTAISITFVKVQPISWPVLPKDIFHQVYSKPSLRCNEVERSCLTIMNTTDGVRDDKPSTATHLASSLPAPGTQAMMTHRFQHHLSDGRYLRDKEAEEIHLLLVSIVVVKWS